MKGDEDLNYAYWLANISGVGNRTIHRLLAQVGSAEELYGLNETRLMELSGMEERTAQRIQESRKRNTEAEYDRLCGRGISFLSLEDNVYPEKLRNIPDAPFGIYVKGRLPELRQKTVAIVGARMCSEYGRMTAKELARQLASSGACIVSGMARGIDAAGHIGALEAEGVTIAVLGCGVDVCYPASNQQLYHAILKHGCILSEYPPETQPKPGFFPARNRIISGLSDAVVLVEAKSRSGSLITADCALEQGKDIYAVPGRICDPLSAGCNNLIRQGAGIISDPLEFKKELDLCGGFQVQQENLNNLLLEKEESLVYSCVDLRPKNIEWLLEQTGLAMPELSGVLEKLQQKGFITETFKNYYIRQV